MPRPIRRQQVILCDTYVQCNCCTELVHATEVAALIRLKPEGPWVHLCRDCLLNIFGHASLNMEKEMA